MGPLHWGLVALLVLYPLLQIPGVLYLSRYVELGEDERDRPPVVGYSMRPHDGDARDTGESSEPTDGPAGADPRPATRRHPAADPPPGTPSPAAVTCAACGTSNDPAFAYCRDCVARLA